MIKAILFDKDGTLLEYSDFRILATRKFISSFKLDSLKATELLRLLGIEKDKVLENSLLASATIEDIAFFIAAYMNEDRSIIYKRLDNFYYKALVKNKEQIRPTCDLKKLFDFLKGKNIKIGLVTSDNFRQAKYSFEYLGLSSYIDFYACGDLYKKKPNKESLYAFLDKFSLSEKELAVCGDSIVDMEFASADNLKIGVLSGTGKANTLIKYADILINSPEGIIKLL
ncbi:MAG: HAD family hydrolase [Peptoniphilaceae bacterium]|nr:HAD family hydrolase [Peptoniphilaceae bacterium]MDY6018184.1 HAD family hydrolase [Anaerococcus sp.]